MVTNAGFPRWDDATGYQTALSRTLYPARISTTGAGTDFRAKAAARRIGELSIIKAHANASLVLHPLAPQNDDYFVLHLQLMGQSLYRHRSGYVDCAVDTLVLTQSRGVVNAEQLTAADAIVVRMPGAFVRCMFRNIDECCWTAVQARAGCADILRNFILGMWNWCNSLSEHDHRMLPLSLFHLLQAVFHVDSTRSEALDNERLYRSLQQEIAVRLQDDGLSAEELAFALGVSRTKLCSLTHDAGTTVQELIIDMRLDRVARWLREGTNTPISELAFSVGFIDLSHFCHRFKQKYGKPASAYRTSFRSDGDAPEASR